jgi:hypothetical protein
MINLEQKQNQKTKIRQVASGSFKRVYLPQIFSNVSKNFFFFGKHLLSDFWGMLKTLLI